MTPLHRVRAVATVAFFVALAILSYHLTSGERGADFYFGSLSALVLAGYGWWRLRRPA
ncbi:MAG: hypothetical protein AAFR79_08660 [Pseudomonadota bacterium]